MNNALEYKSYYGSVDYSAADACLFGKVLGINSLISYEGQSIEELKEQFMAALDEYLELCVERGIEPEKSYKGSFNVRVAPGLHRELALYAALHNQSMNCVVEEAISRYLRD